MFRKLDQPVILTAIFVLIVIFLCSSCHAGLSEVDPEHRPTVAIDSTESPLVKPENMPAVELDFPTPPTAGIESGSVYYVSAINGSDANPGTLEQPFLTITKAASIAEAGNMVYVREGVYVEKAVLSRSGTEAAPIRFLAYPGESPVIDGQNTLGADFDVLLKLVGDHIEVSGFEVKNSAGMCVVLAGKYNKASFINAHHCNNNGILITGDYSIVEDSEVWWTASQHAYGAGSTWASGLTAARSPDGAIIRRNYVHHNWGEGISTYEATGTLIENNIVHDSWSANLYVSDATGVTVKNNTVYDTGILNTGTRIGILLGDEKCLPCSGDNTIIDNHVYNTMRNLYMGFSINPGIVENITVRGNTFEESIHEAGIRVNTGQYQYVNCVVEGNTIIQTDGLPAILDYAGIVGENEVILSVTPPTNTPAPTSTPTSTPNLPTATQGLIQTPAIAITPTTENIET